MPSRKQRRRREKLKRHEWELVQIDEEGNERPVEIERKKKETTVATKGSGKARRPRTARVAKPPSWSRSAKRALLFAPLLYVFLSFGKNPPAQVVRIGIAVLYAAVFIPMFFLVDRMTYRAYQRRSGSG